MKRWIAAVLGLVAVAAVAAVVLARWPASRKRIDCRPVLQSSPGKYRNLAEVDPEGYARPFAKLALDERSRWELEIDDVYAGSHRKEDLARIRTWQRMRFACTGGEVGTPETEIRIYRDGVLTYSTGAVLGEGLQNEELGFVEASSRIAFWWLFRSP